MQVIKNIFYFSGSIILFFAGMIVYGIILNLREIPLEEKLKILDNEKLENVHLVLDRKKFKLNVFCDSVKIKSYRVAIGKNKSKIKLSKHDYVTPVGSYKICSIDKHDKYYKFLQLNYPKPKDAAEALRMDIVTPEEYDSIVLSHKNNETPWEKSELGANIGIHGIGDYDFIFRNLPFTFNWTNGSIATSNKNIDELVSIIKVGTEIKIIN